MPPIAQGQPAQPPSVQNDQQTSKDSAAVALPTASFIRSARGHSEVGQTYQVTLQANTQQLPIKIPLNGWLAIVMLKVDVVAAGNAAVVAFQPDAPWSSLFNINFKDANGNSFSNMSGYSTYLAMKFGCYRLFPWESSAFGLSTTPGVAAGAGGSFRFYLPLFMQFGREGFGVIPNMNGATPLSIDLTINNLAAIYSTLPTNAPTMTIQPIIRTFAMPASQDAMGQALTTEPPAPGTYQLWSSSSYALLSGENTTQLTGALGNAHRAQLYVYRDGTTGQRSEAIVPTIPVTLSLDASVMWNEYISTRRVIQYMNAGIEFPTGVFGYTYTMDPDNIPIGEYAEEYVITYAGTNMVLRHTPASLPAGSSLEVLTCSVVRAWQMAGLFANV